MTKQANEPGTKVATQATPPPGRKGMSLQKAEVKGGTLSLTGDEAAIAEMDEALAVADLNLQSSLLTQLIGVIAPKGTEDATFFLKIGLEAVRAIGPANGAEAMLAVQMACAHVLGMQAMLRASNTDRVDFMDRYANMATKYSRTYLAQLEGLAKLRRNGEQVVKHVHVNEGGQAVIAGTVNTGGPAR